MDLFKLVGSVFIDTEGANDSLAKTDEKAKDVGTSFKDVAGKAAKVGTAIVGASTAAVGGVVALANKSASAADTIDKGAIRMGISTDYYQELGYAAGQSGVEMSTLEKAAKKLEGTDLDLKGAMNEIMSMQTAEERAAKAAELFGESVAYNMSPLIEQSQESFDGLIDRSHELGLVMDESAVKSGVELGDTLSDVSQSFNAIVLKLGTSVMPLVQDFADMILEFMPTIQEAFDDLGPVIQTVFSDLMPPLMDLAQQLLPVVLDVITQLLPPIVELVGALLPVFVEIIQTMIPLLQPIIDMIIGLMPTLTDIVEMILPIVVELFQNLMPILVQLMETILPLAVELLNALLPIIQPLLELLMAILQPLMELLNQILPPLIHVISAVLTVAVKVLGTVIKNVAKAFTDAWNNIKKVWSGAGKFFQNIWKGIKDAFGKVGTWFKDTFSKAWQAVKDVFSTGGKIFDGIKEGIGNVFHNVVNTIIRGINAVVAAPFNTINGIFDKLRGISILGVSPFSWLGTLPVPQIPELARGGEAYGAGTSLVGEEGPELIDMPRGASVVPLSRSALSQGIEDLGDKMDTLINLFGQLLNQNPDYGVYLDGSTLVGVMAPQMDKALGRLAVKSGRRI